MKLGNLKPAAGSVKKRKRVGIGNASGHGKTSGKGSKGAKAHSIGPRPGFEGGQMPLIRRVPKRGFKNIFEKRYEIVNVEDLAIFEANSEVSPEVFRGKGLVDSFPVKVLGKGEIDRPLIVKAHSFSSAALQKIEASGGKAIKC